MLSSDQRSLMAQLLKNRTAAADAKNSILQPNSADRFLPFPLTDVQQSYLAGRGSGMDLGGTATRGYQEFDIKNLDPRRYEHAWLCVIARHDTLRTIINADATQQVLPKIPSWKLLVKNLRNLPTAQQNLALDAVRQEMTKTVTDPQVWPLFDVRISLLDHGLARVHLGIDALLLDASSFPILLEELQFFYDHPDAVLPEPELRFRDYVLALEASKHEPEFARARDYWLKRLPTLAPAPEFHGTSTLREEDRHFRRYSLVWPLAEWQAMERKAAHMGITGAFVLLAAYAEVIRLWNRYCDFTLSISRFNRVNLHPGVPKILGDFTDILLLECRCPSGSTLLDRAQLLQQQFWQDMEHARFNGVQVIRELRQIRPDSAAMPVAFTDILKAGDIGQSARLGGEELELRHAVSQTAQVLIDFNAIQFAGEVRFNWDVAENAFPAGRIEAMFSDFSGLLRRMAIEDEVFSETFPLRAPVDDRTRHATANATATPLEQRMLHQLFDAQALAYPGASAVITPERRLNYGELRGLARTLGEQIWSQGIKSGELVAVVMERDWEQALAVLGILYAGAAYLPIDPNSPAERLHNLLAEGRVKLVLTQQRLNQSLNWPAALQVLAVDEWAASASLLPQEQATQWHQSLDDLAYVIFTSGSTGKPKGVGITHGAAVNTLADINRRLGVTHKDAVLALSDLNFDLSVYDLFGLWAAGGTVVFPASDRTRDPGHWVELMTSTSVSLWNTVPALMQALIPTLSEKKSKKLNKLRAVLLSGDWVPVTLPGDIHKYWPGARVLALGGATEAAIWSNCFEIGKVPEEWSRIPYGRPLANQHLHILNDALQECPDNVLGQIFISGRGLAQGYWNDQQKTDMAFLIHPETGERLYRTGDLGFWRSDGNVEFMGRLDFQVKIGGYRIELGEIEAILGRHPGIKDCVVSCISRNPGNSRQLICHYVPEIGQELEAADLRSFLLSSLPRYMTPDLYVRLKALPLNANGKVNRHALPIPVDVDAATKDFEPPQAGLESLIAGFLAEATGQPHIGRHDNFFELGGNSLMAMQIMHQIQQRLDVSLQLGNFFDAPTVASLATLVNQSMKSETIEEGTL